MQVFEATAAISRNDVIYMTRDSRFSRMLHVLRHLAEADGPMTSEVMAKGMSANPVVIRWIMAGRLEFDESPLPHRFSNDCNQPRNGCRSTWQRLSALADWLPVSAGIRPDIGQIHHCPQ